MKTIEVSDEMYNALLSISKELNTQNHRSTRMPYMIQVSKEVEVAAYEGCGRVIWVNEEGIELSDEDQKELIGEYIYEHYDEPKDFDDLDDFEIESILEDLNCREIEVTTVIKLSNFFFTEKGLRDMYGDVDTFLTGVTNPELEIVMKFLCELSGGKLHK